MKETMLRPDIIYLHTMYEIINSCTKDKSLENSDLVNTVSDIVLYYFEFEAGKNDLFDEETNPPIKEFAEKFRAFADVAIDLYGRDGYYLLMQQLPEWAAVKTAATEAIRVFTDYMLSMGIIPGSIYAEEALRALWREYRALVLK